VYNVDSMEVDCQGLHSLSGYRCCVEISIQQHMSNQPKYDFDFEDLEWTPEPWEKIAVYRAEFCNIFGGCTKCKGCATAGQLRAFSKPGVKGGVKPGHCGGVKVGQSMDVKWFGIWGRRGAGA
jgi:hypothetical protein